MSIMVFVPFFCVVAGFIIWARPVGGALDRAVNKFTSTVAKIKAVFKGQLEQAVAKKA